MSDGDKSSIENIKKYYLTRKNKRKNSKMRISVNNPSSIKDLGIKEKPTKLSQLKFPTSRNLLPYFNENNDNYTANNSNTINTSNLPKKFGKRNTSRFMTSLTMDKVLSSSPKKSNNSNDIFETKFSQSVNRVNKSGKIPALQIYDYNNYNNYNNSVFISHLLPIDAKSFSRFRPEREIFQKIGSLDILAQSSIENKKQRKKIPNINYPYFREKNLKTIDNFNDKNEDKKIRCYYPSVKTLNSRNTERININEKSKKIFDDDDNELNKKLKISFSSENKNSNDIKNNNTIKSYNYKVFNNINSICKPTIINDVTIKNNNEYNTFNKNFYSIGDDKNISGGNSIKTIKKIKNTNNSEYKDSKKSRMRLLRKFPFKKATNKTDCFLKPKKSGFIGENNEEDKKEFKKKVIMNLKNNIQFYNKLSVNKKPNDENKKKHKILLFPNSKYSKNPPKEEKIKEDKKQVDKNNNNDKENITNNSKINNTDDSFSSKKETTFNFISSEGSETTIKRNIKINTVNETDKSDKNKKTNNDSNKNDNNVDEKNKDNENKLKEDAKNDEENNFRKKKLKKIKSKLKKISKESYVFNTCKKEIKNNFVQDNVIEILTTRIIETFGLRFLEEDKVEKMIEEKLLKFDKSKPSKEGLKNENNTYLMYMVKIFKKLHTQKIKIKYKFNLARAEKILNIYETHLLKVMDTSFNKMNGPRDCSMEMINYICRNKEATNYKGILPNKIVRTYTLNIKEKNACNSKEKELKKNILKVDKYFFKRLEEIQKELHFITLHLHLRISLLDVKFLESADKLKSEIILKKNKSDKKVSVKSKKTHELNKSAIFPIKKVKNIKPNINPLKKSRSAVFQPKLKLNVGIGKKITKLDVVSELYSRKVLSRNPDNYLFSSYLYRSNTKRISNCSYKKIRNKLIENIIREEKYKKDVEEKSNKLKSTENNIIGLNIFKNKSLFTKSYIKKGSDVEEKISEICKSRKKLRNFGKDSRNNKTDAIIIKSNGFGLLTREAVSIKTQEIENDLPDAKLFEKFVIIIQKRKFHLFERYADLLGEKFLKIINRRDLSTGNTMLCFAAKNKLLNFMKFLLMKGANPNIQNNFGDSPLHLAYKLNSSFMINLLLEYKANKKLENSDGLLPWQMPKYDDD